MKLIILLILFFIVGCNSEDKAPIYEKDLGKIELECSLIVKNNVPVIDILLKNLKSENIYLFLSYWEVTGLEDSTDIFFGYPTETYIVNQVQYYPKSMDNKSIKYKGEKRDYPLFKSFPKVMKLGQNQSQRIVLFLNSSLIQTLDIEKYDFYFLMPFTTQRVWNSLKNEFGEKIKHAIIPSNNIGLEISIPNVRKIFTYDVSNIEITADHKNISLHTVFDNWIKGRCRMISN